MAVRLTKLLLQKIAGLFKFYFEFNDATDVGVLGLTNILYPLSWTIFFRLVIPHTLLSAAMITRESKILSNNLSLYMRNNDYLDTF